MTGSVVVAMHTYRRMSVMEDAPREPFTLKKADEELGWLDPADEHEEMKVFGQYLETAYRRAAMENGYEEEHMRIKNLPAFFNHIMDIDRRGLEYHEQKALLSKVEELKRMEGLVNPDQVLYHGYLCAGKVLDFMKKTYDEMRQARKAGGQGEGGGGGGDMLAAGRGRGSMGW